ncbi:MAG TPA: hypothetical protein VGE86_01045, partial [Thermoanaerobaculia bacterium]
MKIRSAIAALLFATSLPLAAQTTVGTWTTMVPEDENALELSALPPLGNEGAMNCSRNVIPVKFAPSAEENVLLPSDLSDADATNDASSITFDPEDATLTVSELTNLTAVYEVVEGNCGGGSLRWSIDTTAGNVFVYYGAAPSFTD